MISNYNSLWSWWWNPADTRCDVIGCDQFVKTLLREDVHLERRVGWVGGICHVSETIPGLSLGLGRVPGWQEHVCFVALARHLPSFELHVSMQSPGGLWDERRTIRSDAEVPEVPRKVALQTGHPQRGRLRELDWRRRWDVLKAFGNHVCWLNGSSAHDPKIMYI